IEKLRPDDSLAVVAFAHDAQVVLGSTPLADKVQIEDVIRRIDRFHVDQAGTSMNLGMQMGLEEVAKSAGPGRLSQVVVLTDGETSNADTCKQLAQEAAQKKVPLTLMGVGTEWNSGLIKELARLSEGKWYYIDANQAQDAERVFREEFEHLAATAFTN